MPHLKCVACRVRLRTSGLPGDGVGDLCPECGVLLEPVERLSEILGFRSITLREAEPVGTGQRLADSVGDIQALRRAREEREELRGAFRWLDDDGNFDPGSIAAALAQPAPPLDPTGGDR
jgi:hypothetical protein